ncbi:hypothetical protein HMPREF0201_04288 [Cedecea davisae DSM 4568]|uniref:Uncharacterized protein n=1 Tax=Cedecea davisae DSM 4568 TaxID=566551 RepID=S3JJ74_9ENTR|nr:hypothetical protein HMPREF0201_04288 [Cedecea davisae DSM 4568]
MNAAQPLAKRPEYAICAPLKNKIQGIGEISTRAACKRVGNPYNARAVFIDSWFDMNPGSSQLKRFSCYQTMSPIGGLCMNDYTPPSIVMGASSNFFRL